MSEDARKSVLDRIQSALADRLPLSRAQMLTDWQAIPRAYEQIASLSAEALLDLLEDRLRDYDAEVIRVRDDQVAAAISSVLVQRGRLPTLLPQGFPSCWTPSDVSLTVDEGFSTRELDHYDGVVTGAVVAIAETGTLVLQAVAGQGRRAANLVPDFHLCVVRAPDVVQTVPEAFVRIACSPTLPTTFVSGPSATADIEMTRIKGVHGPRFLSVLLVTDQRP